MTQYTYAYAYTHGAYTHTHTYAHTRTIQDWLVMRKPDGRREDRTQGAPW